MVCVANSTKVFDLLHVVDAVNAAGTETQKLFVNKANVKGAQPLRVIAKMVWGDQPAL